MTAVPEVDETLYCVNHRCGRSIVLKAFPQKCLHCGLVLELDDTLRIESPFNLSSDIRHCSILLKRSIGNFDSFWRSSDLHIGISDSKGDIFSYSKFGLISDYQVDWKSCILIFKSSDFGIRNVDWDHILEFLVDSPLIWSAERYNESSYNCLDFVLTFVRILANSSFCKFNEKVETLKCLVDKVQFVEQFVKKKIVRARKFILLQDLLGKYASISV